VIYTDLAATLADARQRASSVTQLIMLDQIIVMIGNTLMEYKNFNYELFLEKCKYGYEVPIYSSLEEQ
jgi:hypothetical protein